MRLPFKVGNTHSNVEKLANLKTFRKVKHMNITDIRTAKCVKMKYGDWNSMVGLC